MTNTAFTNTIIEREPRDTLAFILPITNDITNLHCIQLSHIYTFITVEIISGYNRATPLTNENITTAGPFAGQAVYSFENNMHTLTLKEDAVIDLEHTLEILVSVDGNGNPQFTINLSGGVIQRKSGLAEDTKFPLITIGNSKGLKLQDNTTTKHYFTYKSSAARTRIPQPTSEQIEGAKSVSAFDRSTAVDGTSVFYVEGGCITGGIGSSLGGGVYVHNGGTLTMGINTDGNSTHGGNIIGNCASSGGGVLVTGSSTFEMFGTASIVGNSGGGIKIDNGCTFEMSDSSRITGNSGDSVGGVWNRGIFTMMDNASITGNSGGLVGGVLVTGSSTFMVSGTPAIKNNTKGGSANNVYLAKGKTITVSAALSSPTLIGVTTAESPSAGSPVSVTGDNGSSDYSTYFTSDNASYGIKNAGDGEHKVVKLFNRHSVTYDGSGSTSGSAPIDPESPYIEGSEITVLGNTGGLEKTDYTFSGWNTKADGTGTNYTDGDKIENIAADIKLYAKWTVAPSPGVVSDVTLDKSASYVGDTVAATVTGTDGVVTITYPDSLGGGTEDVTITSGTVTGAAKTVASAASGQTVSAKGSGQTESVVSDAITTYDKALTVTASSASVEVGTDVNFTVSIPLALNSDLDVTLADNGSTAAGISGLSQNLKIPAGQTSVTSAAVSATGAGDLIVMASDKNAVFSAGGATVTVTVPTAYTITTSVPSGHGTITVSPSSATAGTKVTITPVADSGYQLSSLTAKQTSGGTAVPVAADHTFTMPAAAVTVTAVFEVIPPQQYRVTFNVQGHGEQIPAKEVTIGEKVPEPSPTPSAEYYTFGGWYTDSGCAEDTKWNFDDSVEKDMTLYAKWTIDYYAAKMGGYDYAGGLLPAPVLLPEDIPGASYFYSKSADGEKIPWSEITSTTSLDAGTYYIGANDPEDLKDIHRSVFTIRKASQPGPEFTAVESGGEIIISLTDYKPDETYMYSIKEQSSVEEDKWVLITNGTATVAGLKTSTTYEIKVKINAKGNYRESISAAKTVTTGSTFSVTYNANGGVGCIEPQTGTAGQPVIVAPPAGKITREGYDFVAWATNPDGYVKRYNPGYSISEGVTLYAQWTPQTYTITFDGNGGTVSSSHLQFKYGETVNLSDITAFRDGYAHSGWALSDKGSAVYAAKQKVQNLGNITLYAVWTHGNKVHSVTVTSSEEYAYIELKQGGVTVCGDFTEGGVVHFSDVAEGIYTLVATKDGKMVTRTEIITGETEIYVSFPSENISSEVVIKTENATPAVAVGGVDTAAEGAAEYGKSVTVKVTVEAKTEGSTGDQQTQIEIEKIKKEAAKTSSASELQYLGITVEKTVDGVSEKLTSTANLLEFIIPYDFTNKDQVKLYRCHDGTAEPLREIKSKDDKDDGTYLLDEGNGRISLYADKFSIYSIGYVPTPPKPFHKSSSQGTSYWATETPTVTPTPTSTAEPTQGPTQGVPTVKPTTQTPTGKSPMPVMGILAGLGAAAVLALRRK